MEAFNHTLFINLEHRTDRLEHTLSQFKLLDIQGERVDAIKTDNGAIGCTMSHIKCLKYAKACNWSHVFICEDDILFTNPQILLDSVDKFWDNKNIDWDVLIIGGNNSPPYAQITDYCIKINNCQTATGYIVRQSYYDTLIANLREGLSNLILYPQHHYLFALDMYWKQLQKKDNWYLLIPLTVTQKQDYSDIQQKHVNYEHWLLKKR